MFSVLLFLLLAGCAKSGPKVGVAFSKQPSIEIDGVKYQVLEYRVQHSLGQENKPETVIANEGMDFLIIQLKLINGKRETTLQPEDFRLKVGDREYKLLVEYDKLVNRLEGHPPLFKEKIKPNAQQKGWLVFKVVSPVGGKFDLLIKDGRIEFK